MKIEMKMMTADEKIYKKNYDCYQMIIKCRYEKFVCTDLLEIISGWNLEFIKNGCDSIVQPIAVLSSTASKSSKVRYFKLNMDYYAYCLYFLLT